LAGDPEKGVDLLKTAYELDPNGKGPPIQISDLEISCWDAM